MNDQQRMFCEEKLFQACGTLAIFELRVYRLSRFRDVITFFGILVPICVGSLMLSFGTDLYKSLAYIAGIFTLIQLIFSVWSVVAKWDDRYTYAVDAVSNLTKIFCDWNDLVKLPPPDVDMRIKELTEANKQQDAKDMIQKISDKEKRYGMRKALFLLQKQCPKCQTVPSLHSKNQCDACGNF